MGAREKETGEGAGRRNREERETEYRAESRAPSGINHRA